MAAVAARPGDSIATVQQVHLHEFDAVRREDAPRDALAAMVVDGSAIRYRLSP